MNTPLNHNFGYSLAYGDARIQIGTSPFFRSFAFFLMMNKQYAMCFFSLSLYNFCFYGNKISLLLIKTSYAKVDNQRQMSICGSKIYFQKVPRISHVRTALNHYFCRMENKKFEILEFQSFVSFIYYLLSAVRVRT